jgi:hypothetical protein
MRLHKFHFDTLNRAHEHELQLIDRSHSYRRRGSHPYYCVIGPAGAPLLAANAASTLAVSTTRTRVESSQTENCPICRSFARRGAPDMPLVSWGFLGVLAGGRHLRPKP